MARTFDGTDDVIYQIVPVGAGDVGFGTFAAILRCTSFAATRAWMRFWNASFANVLGAFFNTSGQVGMSNGVAAPAGSTGLVVNEYYCVAVGKPTGNTRPRVHLYRYSTNAFVHENTGGNMADAGAPGVGGLSIGARLADQYMPGDIAVAGFWARELSDAEFERLPFTLLGWHSLSPTGLWLYDQSDVAQTVPDLTGNLGNQGGIVGTSVSTNNVPIFNQHGDVWVVIRPQGAGVQTISPNAIASLESFGTNVLSPGVVSISPTGIVSLEALGTSQVNLHILLSAIASLEQFGSHTLSPGNVNVDPPSITSLEALGSHTLSVGAVILTPSSINSLEAFGTTLLTLYVTPTGLSSLEGFGAQTLVPGNVNIIPSGIDTLEALGSNTVSIGAVIITPSSITTLESFGTLSLGLFITPTGVSSLEFVSESLITVYILPSSITSSEEFGEAELSTVGSLNAQGISSLEEFGTNTITPGPVNITVTGISSVESFGDLITSVGGTLLLPSAIESLEAHGNQAVTVGNVNISPNSIESLEVFGNNTLHLFVVPTSIDSIEQFGTTTFDIGALIISPDGIVSVLNFGAVTVTGGAPVVIALARALISLYQYAQAIVTSQQAQATVQITNLKSEAITNVFHPQATNVEIN